MREVDTSAELTCYISSSPLTTHLIVPGIHLLTKCSQVNGDSLSLVYILLFFAKSQILGRIYNKLMLF